MSSRIGDLASFRRDVTRRRATAVFDASIVRAARRTIADVRRRGDAAVLANVRRFDRPDARVGDLWIDARELRDTARRCAPELRVALDRAYDAILAFHRKQRPRQIAHRARAFSEVLVPSPLARVGGCVPRGFVGYPSTALMIGIPAGVAGVEDLVLASPMPRDGSVDPALAYAARK